MTGREDTWAAVDAYLVEAFSLEDDVLVATRQACDAAGLPAIGVTAPQGRFLQILARMLRAKSILEIGTLGGYSAIWLGRALGPGGRLVSLEINPAHAAVARANLARAGLDAGCEVLVGPAIEQLPLLEGRPPAPFDFVFIDADKPSIPAYFEWALRLTRRGSLIVVDNVIRKGAVADPGNPDPAVLGVRRLNELMARDPRVSATAIQTVGLKGHDGFALALVVAGD
ncbi:MAG: methyltransferase [Proteobacteria bacterium]|nr:methyltransferase [Pseudomonadota bacterium]